MEKTLFLKELGKRIVQIRQKKNISQAELALLRFKDSQSEERVENGKVNPSAFYLSQLAEALQIHPKELLDFDFSKE